MPRKKSKPFEPAPPPAVEPPVEAEAVVEPEPEVAPTPEVEPEPALKKFRVTCCKVKRPGDPEKVVIMHAEDARSAVIAFLDARPALRSDEWADPQVGLTD